jgi:SulP family sulfate permease
MNVRSKRSIFVPRLLELFPFRHHRPNNFSLTGELLAGVTVGLIALPLALALGIASIPQGAQTPFPAPALGIFTVIVGGAIISLLGGSRVQIGGPTAAFIPIILLIVSQHGYNGLLIATMMAGGILIIMGLTRMGKLIKYIPWPVTSGFTTGIAIAIMMSQVPDLTGISAATAMPAEFVHKLAWIGHHIASFNAHALCLSMVCIIVIMGWPRLKIPYIPGSIVAMLGATLFVALSGWTHTHGIQTIGTKFGSAAIPASLPAPAMPTVDLTMIHDLIGPALAIALLGAIESLLAAVVADGLSGDRHDSNTELIAQGIANLVCPFFCGLPATGAIARTSANISNGGKTPIAGFIHAVTLLVIILLASRWASYIPMPAMSAVLIVVSLRMGEWHELTHLARFPRSDASVLLATLSLTVIFDLVVAVQVGMVLAAVLFIRRISETTEVSRVTHEDMLERPEQLACGKPLPDGVIVYRIFGPFLFGAAEKLMDALTRAEHWPTVLVLRLHLVTAMDTTGMNALFSVVERMKSSGGTVIISGIHRQPLAMLIKSNAIDKIGRPNLCATFDDAINRARELCNG